LTAAPVLVFTLPMSTVVRNTRLWWRTS